jgi:hypothetical protein
LIDFSVINKIIYFLCILIVLSIYLNHHYFIVFCLPQLGLEKGFIFKFFISNNEWIFVWVIFLELYHVTLWRDDDICFILDQQASVLASSVVDCEPLWWKNTPIECGRLLVQSIQIKSRLKFPFSPRNTWWSNSKNLLAQESEY